jgi:hypothetical protein
MKVSHPHPVKHGASWRTKSQIQALNRTALLARALRRVA